MLINLVDNNSPKENSHFFIFNPTDKIRYVTENYNDLYPYLFTDECIFEVDKYTPDRETTFGLLLEPACIKPHVYKSVRGNILELGKRYKRIFTHCSILIGLSNLFKLIPFSGGSFILPEDENIYPKNKNLSIIASEKRYAEGHILRHEVIKKYGDFLDAFGPDYIDLYPAYANADTSTLRGLFNKTTGNLLRALTDYRYAIVIENQRGKYFFTEKIINSFLTGVVPIYWGAETIGDFFDTKGIIQFTDISELDNILPTLGVKDYLFRLEAIKYNFEEAKKYRSYDEHLYYLLHEEL